MVQSIKDGKPDPAVLDKMIADKEKAANEEDPLVEAKTQVVDILRPLIKDPKILGLLMRKLGKGEPLGGVSRRLICGVKNFDDDHPWEIYRKLRVAKNQHDVDHKAGALNKRSRFPNYPNDMDNIHRILDKAEEQTELEDKLEEVMKKPIKMTPAEQQRCMQALKTVDGIEKADFVNRRRGV